jgi:hypothetical protein
MIDDVKETLDLWAKSPMDFYKVYFRHSRTKQEIPFSNLLWDNVSTIICALDKLNNLIPNIYTKITGLKLDNYNEKIIIYCNDDLYAYLSINHLFNYNDEMEE